MVRQDRRRNSRASGGPAKGRKSANVRGKLHRAKGGGGFIRWSLVVPVVVALIGSAPQVFDTMGRVNRQCVTNPGELAQWASISEIVALGAWAVFGARSRRR